MPQKQITVALDIGGVCVILCHDLCYKALGIPQETEIPQKVMDAFCDLECGRISTEEWLAIFREALKFKWTEDEILDAWNRIIGDTMPGMKEKVETYAAKGVKFVFLSDVSALHLDVCYRKCSFCHAVTDGIFSYEVGARKPDPAMYKAFEQRHGIPDFYFDDRPCNIEAARKRGWNAILFSSAEQLDIIGAKI